MYTTSLLSILALASTGLASPTAPLVTGTEGIITSTPVGGALAPTKGPIVGNADVALAAPPQYMTISVINMHGDAITTSHAHNADSPMAVSGNVGPGTMANGATAAFAVPTGWAGNVAINDGQYGITGDDTLIEGSFDVQGNSGYAIVDVDVSYVNGFSVAITCACAATNTVITGCNKNLFNLNYCPDNDGQNACVDPLRNNDGYNLTPAAFFAPCKGAAYTYPHDDAANANGVCQSGVIRCCVGSACPANPNQPS